jgi:hypothetical protein
MLRAFVQGEFQLSKDISVDVAVLSEISDTSGYLRWKLSSDKYFGPPILYDNSGPTYTTMNSAYHVKPIVKGSTLSTNLFLYMDVASAATADVEAGDHYWLNVTANNGMLHASHNDNSAHQDLECSNQGTCNRNTGTCSCFSGFSGAACSRTACHNRCSGHGVCQSQSRFASDAGESYTVAFDSKLSMGCRCDAGYRGPACALRKYGVSCLHCLQQGFLLRPLLFLLLLLLCLFPTP